MCYQMLVDIECGEFELPDFFFNEKLHFYVLGFKLFSIKLIKVKAHKLIIDFFC